MHPILTTVCTFLPTVLLLYYFYTRDAHPEPRHTLVVTFLLGLLITVPIGIVESAIWEALLARHLSAWGLALSVAFLLAAIPEEVFKFLVLRTYCARRPEFDEPMDGMVYGATVALGFATLENFLFAWRGGLPVILGRALTAVPAHAFWGALMGYYVGQARLNPNAGPGVAVKALAVPILLHGLYDFPLWALRLGGTAMDSEEPSGRHVGLVLTGYVLAAAVASFQWVLALNRLNRLQDWQQRRSRGL
jgi:RsiW-degrading membrane proteinase PrsW (M82 family)